MTTDEKTKPGIDLFEQALKNYDQALKAGAKLQEDSVKFFSNLLNQTPAPTEWPKRIKNLVDDFVPQTQKTVEDGLKLIEQTSRTSIELMKKAVAAGQPASIPEAQAKFLGLWEASLNAMKDTAVAATRANHQAIESWINYARQHGETPGTGKA